MCTNVFALEPEIMYFCCSATQTDQDTEHLFQSWHHRSAEQSQRLKGFSVRCWDFMLSILPVQIPKPHAPTHTPTHPASWHWFSDWGIAPWQRNALFSSQQSRLKAIFWLKSFTLSHSTAPSGVTQAQRAEETRFRTTSSVRQDFFCRKQPVNVCTDFSHIRNLTISRFLPYPDSNSKQWQTESLFHITWDILTYVRLNKAFVE